MAFTSKTFAEIGRAPRVLSPLLCLALLAAVVNFVVSNRFGYEKIARTQIERTIRAMEQSNAPAVAIEQARAQAEEQLTPEQIRRRQLKNAAGAAITFPVIVLCVAGVFKLFSLILGVSNRFKSVLSVVSFAYLAIGIVFVGMAIVSVYLKP